MKNAPDRKAIESAMNPCPDYKPSRQADAERIITLHSIRDENPGNGSGTQMKRIMAALRKLQSVTTIECSRFLDVIHPPRRVMELREAGESIATHWRQEPTECGRLHRVGLYGLESPRSTEKSGDEFLLGGAALPEHSLSGLVDSALPGREVRPATCAALLVGGLPA